MSYPFIQAKNYTPGRAGKKVRVIVLHTMETPETAGKAHQVAEWFAGESAPEASAHYCVDNLQIVQSVKDTDTAWAVADELNHESISIELAGRASQTPEQWADAYSKGELDVAAHLAAKLAKDYGVSLIHLTPAQLLDGKTSGFCYHSDITFAKKIEGGHTDPGVNFPLKDFLSRVSLINTPNAVIAGDLSGVKPVGNSAITKPKEKARTGLTEALPVIAVADVQPGYTNASVKLLQAALIKVGRKPGHPDGIFGRATQLAYREWQRDCGYRGSQSDGYPGFTTLARLGAKSGLFEVVA